MPMIKNNICFRVAALTLNDADLADLAKQMRGTMELLDGQGCPRYSLVQTTAPCSAEVRRAAVSILRAWPNSRRSLAVFVVRRAASSGLVYFGKGAARLVTVQYSPSSRVAFTNWS